MHRPVVLGHVDGFRMRVRGADVLVEVLQRPERDCLLLHVHDPTAVSIEGPNNTIGAIRTMAQRSTDLISPRLCISWGDIWLAIVGEFILKQQNLRWRWQPDMAQMDGHILELLDVIAIGTVEPEAATFQMNIQAVEKLVHSSCAVETKPWTLVEKTLERPAGATFVEPMRILVKNVEACLSCVISVLVLRGKKLDAVRVQV